MEAEPPAIPSEITNTFLKLQKKLQQIEVEVIQFTNSPADTPGLDRLAKRINSRFVFCRKLVTTEIASYGSIPPDLSDIEGRLRKLETEFFASVHFNGGSENSSVCEDCLNNDGDVQKRDAGSDGSSVYEVAEMLYEMVVPPSETVTMLPSGPKEDKVTSFGCEKGDGGGGGKRRRRWWWKTVAVLMTVSAVLTVSLTYFDYDPHEGFLTPT